MSPRSCAGSPDPLYMAPAVVLDDQDRPVPVVGSPGGRRIPNIQATVIARWALHGQPLQDAVDGPRFHLEDDQLQVEELPERVSADLTEMGYAVTPVPLSRRACSGRSRPWSWTTQPAA